MPFKAQALSVALIAILLQSAIFAGSDPEVIIRNPVHVPFSSLGIGHSVATSDNLIGLNRWKDNSVLIYDLSDHTSKTLQSPPRPNEIGQHVRFWNNSLVVSNLSSPPRFFLLDCSDNTLQGSVLLPQLRPNRSSQIVAMEVVGNSLYLGLYDLDWDAEPGQTHLGAIVCYDLPTLKLKWVKNLPDMMFPVSQIQMYGKKQIACLAKDQYTDDSYIVFLNMKRGRLSRITNYSHSRISLSHIHVFAFTTKNVFVGSGRPGYVDNFGDSEECGGLIQMTAKGKEQKRIYGGDMGCAEFGGALASDKEFLYVSSPGGSGNVHILDTKTLAEIERISPPPGVKRFGGIIYRTPTHLLVRGVENGEYDGDAVLYAYRR